MSLIVRNAVQLLHRVVGNLEPIGAQLVDQNGDAVDLTGKTVKFRMAKILDGSVKVNDQVSLIDDASSGKVSYTPVSSDVDTAGEYAAYFFDDSSPDRLWPYDGARFVIVIKAETVR